jgi:superfamily I DNA/RNA helicase
VNPVLSPQQIAAVEARGEVVVAAGAGTGKTTVVIERVRAALEAGTAPERVLVVTYTEAAARELALRLEHALPSTSDDARPQVGTIHALATRLLREYAAEAGLPSELRVLDEAEALVLSEAAFGDAIAREPRDGESVLLDLLGEYGLARAHSQPGCAAARRRRPGAPAAAGPSGPRAARAAARGGRSSRHCACG